MGVGDLVRLINPSETFRTGSSQFAAHWGQQAHKRLYGEAALNKRSTEVHVSHSLALGEYSAVITGRIDLIVEAADKTIVQEIKTVAAPGQTLEAATEDSLPSFRDQLRLYLYLLECSGYKNLHGELVVVSLMDGSIARIPVTYDLGAVYLLIRSVLLGVVREHEQSTARKDYRRSLAKRIGFPHEEARRYQEEAAASVRNALETRNNLLLSAPTGVGKTAAVLAPALRFALENDLRIFWASGKSSHQEIVATTLRLILPPDAQISALFLMAKEKLCPNELFSCEEHLCRYSQEYSARSNQAAVKALLQQQLILPEDVIRVARENDTCPFELSLQAASNADFIVGDYNYVFDPKSSLRRLLPPKNRRGWILIIDEAHNLYSRARGYFSPSISVEDMQEASRAAGESHVAPDGVLSLLDEVKTYVSEIGGARPSERQNQFIVEIDKNFFRAIGGRTKEILSDYFLARLRAGMETGEDPLARCLTDIDTFCTMSALEGDFAFLFDSTAALLKQVCLDPSLQIGKIINSFFSVIAVSATLEPHRFFQDVLGFPADETIAASFPSPFHRENRKIVIVPNVSTTYRDRTRTAPGVAHILQEISVIKPGNYAAFFPSYAYLRLIATHLQDFCGNLVIQKETLQKSDIVEMVRVLRERRSTNLILAVQGGSLAEGVDYSDNLLDGIFIVGVGLPELSLENELLKAHFDEKYSAGFQYAYLYPGMMRVIQSAGRLIRSADDIGFIILIGRRYATPAYNSLLPRDWYRYSIEELIASDAAAEVRAFWDSL